VGHQAAPAPVLAARGEWHTNCSESAVPLAAGPSLENSTATHMKKPHYEPGRLHSDCDHGKGRPARYQREYATRSAPEEPVHYDRRASRQLCARFAAAQEEEDGEEEQPLWTSDEHG